MTDLTERLRDDLRKQMDEQDDTLPDSVARQQGLVWLEGWFDLSTTLETLTQENARLKVVSEDHFRNAQRLAGEVAKRDVENARLRGAGWRDIKSAPRDGRDALVGCWVINYDEPEKPPVWSAWETVFDGGPLGCDGTWGDEPTHWHDMPAPPPLPARKALGGGDE